MTLMLISPGFTAWAQEDVSIVEIIDAFAEQLPEDYDLYELTERLTYYKRNPVDLNNCTPEELKKLIFLSPLQITALFAHINQNGKLLDVLELQGIDGFNIQTINRILPFVKVNPPLPLKLKHHDMLQNNNTIIMRYSRILQTQKGFRNLQGSRYLGSPDKLLFRYRYNYTDFISAALVMEKDAGEHLFNRKTGLDHISGNIYFQKLGIFKKLVIGDYSLQFGQGLALWSGFALGKGADVTSIAAKDFGLRPYSSSNEASFFRGTATTIAIGNNLELTSFISFRKLDASLKTNADQSPTLENINSSGLHRTATELKNQKSQEQFLYGGALQYGKGQFNMGLVAYNSQYQHPFTTGKQLYNKYAFAGKDLVNATIHYNYTYKNIYFYGELAQSIGSGQALVQGMIASISPKVSSAVLYRDYQRHYHSFFSNAIGEGSEANNERGWYAGVNYMPDKQLLLFFYTDYFRFPWLKYRIDAPSAGYETILQTNYTPNKTDRISIRYKREQKAQNPETGSTATALQQVLKQNFRLEAKWNLNDRFSFQHRGEIVHYQKASIDEMGYLVCQDINYKPLSSMLTGNFRLSYFHTASYNSRLYAYEDDVLHGSGFGIYHGKGIRSFLNLRYRLMKPLDVWFRYAISVYSDAETLGSGLDEIQGNSKSDVKIQIRYQF